ncbi:MAG: hypothetical protein EPN25_12890 [Nitrospirae bacterium]|nr:MAG: hypothetical protein EPN25_12890 [Nitrospirota bacterium]
MEWKCPECGIQHEEASQECSCGYSFFKTLGVKPGSSAEEVKKAYKYARAIWEKESGSDDQLLRKKAGDRLKKIETAYETFLQYSSAASGKKKAAPNKVLLAASAAGVIVVIVIAIFILRPKSRGNQDQQSGPGAAKQEVTALQPGATPQSTSPGDAPAVIAPGGSPQNQIPLAITEERAIELVKASTALFKNTPVSAIVNKWIEDNSGKYKMVGWQAKKFDEQKILVSYIAMDGDTPKGFYFDVDIQSGAVQNLANNPELQKKYNILYSH